MTGNLDFKFEIFTDELEEVKNTAFNVLLDKNKDPQVIAEFEAFKKMED